MVINYEIVSSETFNDAILFVITQGDLYKKNIDVKLFYNDYDCYLSKDHKSGFAIHKTKLEIVNVFSLVKGRGKAMLKQAVKKYKFLKLDCFDGYLPGFYGSAGFSETARFANWTEGEPDVVFMEYRK